MAKIARELCFDRSMTLAAPREKTWMIRSCCRDDVPICWSTSAAALTGSRVRFTHVAAAAASRRVVFSPWRALYHAADAAAYCATRVQSSLHILNDNQRREGYLLGGSICGGRLINRRHHRIWTGNDSNGCDRRAVNCKRIPTSLGGRAYTCRALVHSDKRRNQRIADAAVEISNRSAMGVPMVQATAAGGDGVAQGGDWKDGERGVIFDCSDIALVTGGVLWREGSPGSICTDSRDLQQGDWFLCLKGPNFDGHDFLQMALERECAGAIGCQMPAGWTRGFVHVSDTLDALQALGKSVRLRFTGPVIGITGSVGKTTTRAMAGLALESLGHIHETGRNFNNHVGLPLTLLRMPSSACACVLELGMNHLGEIKELSEIAIPNIRVITNVGPVHLEGLGSIENIARAKGELFDTANEGDVCVINADDARVASLPIPHQGRVRVVQFGRTHGCDVQLLDAEPIDGGRAIKCTFRSYLAVPKGSVSTRVEIKINSPGLHLAECACAALAIAGTLNVPADVAAESISKYQPVGMRLRLEFLDASGITLINDAYNASPITVEGALKFLSSLHTEGRRIALLGDMLELGSEAIDYHSKIVKLCQKLKIDLVALVGQHFGEAVRQGDLAPPLQNLSTFPEVGELAGRMHQLLRPGDAVLVKGSRGIHMESVVEAVKKISLQDTTS